MPSHFSRLRFWIGFSALAMIAVVAGFYIYARYRVQRAMHDLPAKLGVDIQQNTEGFTYSQAAGGHTIFSITASKAIRYRQGGKAELHNVKIVSFGRNSDRMDEISGDDFEYDAQSGDITAKGKVAIRLQATQPGTSKPAGEPVKIGSSVALETSGLIFNRNTGIARTSQKISFELPQGKGSAIGATYDSKQNSLHLVSDIHLLAIGPQPIDLQAVSAVFLQEAQELTLTELRAESGIRRLEARNVVLHLREDNTIERADATGGVTSQVKGARAAQVHAAEAHLQFGVSNMIASARLAGGVNWETTGEAASRGTAGRVLMTFAGNNEIRSAQLRDSVDLLQASTDQPSGSEFRGDGLDLQIAQGKTIQTVTSVGAAQIVLSSARGNARSGASRSTSSSGARTLITASRFDAKFSTDNRLSTLTGSAPVKIVSSTPGQPDRISESHDLLATFTKGKNQALDNAIQTGNVQIAEGQRSASADRATFSQANDTMTLSGNVHYKDASMGATLSSNTLALDRATGETSAIGDVKTTYVEQKAGASGGMLSSSRAVHVTAPQMVARNSIGEATYSGGARLWQAGNIIQAATIRFNRGSRTLDAEGQGSRRVSTAFAQPDRNGKETPVEVTADRLHYEDSARKAIFDGSLVVQSADSTLQSNRAVVTLRPAFEKAAAPKTDVSSAPSQVQSIEATGNITLQQTGRRAIGERLLYTADEQKFVLTGTPGAPPSIFDAEHGQVTGVSLTFFNRDGRVLVDSSNSTSISQTRLKK